MDKNFVDIDNLVRQRLGGGEAQERAGSWQNMRELLDKEMPQEQAPAGFFGRRMFGAVALLLLVGAAGVGGYKVMTSGNNPQNNSGQVASETVVTARSGSSANGSDVASQPGATGANGNNAEQGTGVNATNAADHSTGGGNGIAGNNTSANGNSRDLNTDPAANRNANSGTANGPSTAGNNVAANSSSARVNTVPGVNAGVQNTHTGNAATTQHNNTNAAVATRGNNNGNIPGTVAANATRPAKAQVNGNTPAQRNTSAGNNITAGVETHPGVPVFVTKTGARIPGDKLQRLNTDKARQNNNNMHNIAPAALSSKKVIQKMRLVERFIKTAPNGEGFYKMDTVSVVTLTEELGIITETKTVPKPSNDTNSGTNNK